MGNLVFQATLGGQVNLVGPNTASTYNINVPAIAGTLVTTGDTGTVTNTMLAGSIANAKLLNSSVTIGSTAVSLGSTVTAFAGITTLSMSSDLTLSGGTANGVAYLNGSKVVTTGSALTFDGSSLTTPTVYATGGQGVRVSGGGTFSGSGVGLEMFTAGGVGYYTSYDRTGSAYAPLNLFSGTYTAFSVGSEQMRLTSTGLGIGTSSPGYKLDVLGTSDSQFRVNSTSGAQYTTQIFANNGTAKAQAFWDNTNNNFYIGTLNSGASLKFGVGVASTAATLDSSGNLGLGVTPSAWASGRPAIQFSSTVSAYVSNANTGAMTIGSNQYYDGSNERRVVAGYASQFYQYQGQHVWLTAASSTAGSVITYTQAMTLDASGNLVVGSTSANGKFSVSNAGANGFEVYPDALPDSSSGTRLQSYNRSTSAYVPQGYNASDFRWFTSSTERARIDSSGNLLVGTTSTSETSGTGIKIMPNGQGTNVGEITIVTAGTSSGQSSYNLYSTGAGAYRFYVDNAGTIHATSIVISAISDQRLKENVRDIDTGLSTIMALKPRRFDWKEGKGQDKKNAAGFIAQEFEEVFPECVSTSKAGADGIEYKNISHETLIPTLVKAIQELKAEFDAYKASHP